MQDVEDEALMLELAAGRTEALDVLMNRYERRLYGYLHRFLSNAGDAQDAYQEVWLRVFQSRARYVRRARFSTWLYRIATNLATDVLRRRRPTVAVAQEPGDDGSGVVLAAAGGGPEEAVERGRLARAISEAVAGLPDGQREVFLLAEGEDLAYAEIAEVLSVPVGTVKSRMHHACRALQARLRSRR